MGNILHDNIDKVEHQYYDRSRCLRTYFLDTSRKEYTIQFAVQTWWINDITAFFNSTTPIIKINCIRDVTI